MTSTRGPAEEPCPEDPVIERQLKQLTAARNRLEKYSRELEKKNRELEGFVRSVAHDLKTPLIAIQGFLAMFEQEFKSQLSGEALFYLGRVQANGEQMQTLIHQLLKLTHSGQIDDQFAAVSPKHLAEQVCSDLAVQISAKEAKITVTGCWPDKIVAEPVRLKQALSNLVDNALSYSGEDRPVRVKIGLEEARDAWRFYVEDNGEGIEPDDQDRVFEIFERLAGSEQKNRNGTGIGLAIVKRVAEAHGGNVKVVSTPGAGSRFYLEISKSLSPKNMVHTEA